MGSDQDQQALDDFKVVILGGKWTMQHKHTAFDAIQGIARGGLAKEFCDRRGLQQSMRFDVSAYGQERCQVLARAFCHKMQYFLQAEIGNQDLVHKPFPPNVVGEYVEPSEMTKIASGQLSKALEKRICQIRELLSK